MKRGQASSTADMTAMVRAHEHLYADGETFDDRFALALTSPGWQRVLRSRAIKTVVLDGLLRPFRGGAAVVLGRARYLEDQLPRLAREGCAQYVVVGAGMDSFSLRRPLGLEGLRVIELDHPGTQAVKRERLSATGAHVGDNVELVAVDFEAETVADALGRSAYDATEPAVFGWMGVTYYLAEETVYATIASMASCCAPGSELLFDYQVPRALAEPKSSRVLRRLDWMTAKVGEPVLAELDRQVLATRLREMGFEVAADLSADALDRMYFAHRESGLRVPAGMRVMHARRIGSR
ncbi:MAG: SAM-dependent methyltransferase [Myxococcota bacterium]